MNSKAIKRQLLAAIAMVLVAAIALGSSTYAWFVSNTEVQATSSSVKSTSATPNLLIVAGATETGGAVLLGLQKRQAAKPLNLFLLQLLPHCTPHPPTTARLGGLLAAGLAMTATLPKLINITAPQLLPPPMAIMLKTDSTLRVLPR